MKKGYVWSGSCGLNTLHMLKTGVKYLKSKIRLICSMCIIVALFTINGIVER